MGVGAAFGAQLETLAKGSSGTKVGMSVCGALPCLALGVLFTVLRLRCAHTGECIGCGHCDSRCPFGVAQSERMGIIADHFGL